MARPVIRCPRSGIAHDSEYPVTADEVEGEMKSEQRKKVRVTKAKKTAKPSKRYVVVVTASRPWSIVAGWLQSQNADGSAVELSDARMISYFSQDAKTVYGVAERGPGRSARVSPPVTLARVRNVEHILDVTPSAKEAIEAGPWT